MEIVIFAVTMGVLIVLAVVVGLRFRGRERVIGAEADDAPVQRLDMSAPAPAAAPAAVPPLGSVDLESLLESRILRRAVARADKSGEQELAVQTVMRLTGLSDADARAFLEKVRQRGIEKE
jgi:hypothetical protein